MKFQNQVLSLHSDALAADTLMVQKLSGRERMSGLFRFELDLICSDPELDLEAVLYAPAKLGIKVQMKIAGGQVGTSTREIAGVFEEFEQLEEGQGWTKYRAVLVPKLWNTTRSYRSRIFQEMAIEDIVKAVLEKDDLDPDLDFEFQLQRAGDEDPKERAIYPEREYVVQYEESDWHFLARWLEHEGIYFYFTNEDGEEKVVFADTESSYGSSPFGDSYPYRPEATGEGADSDKFTEEEVRSFRCKQTRLPTQVTVNDYNWRVPSARLHFSEEVREHGTGLQTEYNDHFKDEAQGKALAKVRKEELACRAKVFHGTGSCRAFRPGTTFSLEDHFRDDFNRSYLLVEVTHEAEQMISLESATITGFKYENAFAAIPDDQPWRPQRLTEWPSIKGVMHAKIDAESDGEYAELDEHGRYKIRMPYDEHSDEADDGKASRWVRMAQPYAGQNAGMHFPLAKGTEVLVTHIDGDPDRPIISGAVPNPENESPATSANQTRNAIKTRSGNVLEMDDNLDSRGLVMMDASRSIVSDGRRRSRPTSTAASSSPTGGNGNVVPTNVVHNPMPAVGDVAASHTAAAAAPGTPAGGNGMVFGSDASVSTQSSDNSLLPAWRQFFSGDAFKQIQDHGTLNTVDNQGPTLTDANLYCTANLDNTDLTESNIAKCLNYVLKHHKKGTGDDEETPLEDKEIGGNTVHPRIDGKLGDLIKNKGQDFLGSAKGTRLKLFLDDSVTFNIGDSYTYSDGTYSVSVGTGGISRSETLGDADDFNITHGKQRSRTMSYGGQASYSHEFSGKASFGLTVSVESANSVNLGLFNSNSLNIGLFGGLSVLVAGKAEVEIGAAAILQTEIAPATWHVDLSADTKVQLQTTEVKMQKSEAALNKTIAQMLSTKSSLTETDNHLSILRNAIASNQNKLNDNNNVLTKQQNMLTAQHAGISTKNMALDAKSYALLNDVKGVLTSL